MIYWKKNTERRLVRQRKSRIGAEVCYGLVCDSLPKVYILKLLLPMWWYLKMWRLGWNLGKMRSWEWGLMIGLVALQERKVSLPFSPCAHTKDTPYEEVMRRWLSATQEEGPHWRLIAGTLVLVLQNFEKLQTVCWLNIPSWLYCRVQVQERHEPGILCGG